MFEAAVAAARANVQAAEEITQAKAQAADSERKLALAKQLAEQKLIAQADLDTALAEAEVAPGRYAGVGGHLGSAQAQRHQAEVNLTYTTIRSPIDGTVISRAVDVGQTVAASLSSPTLFTIAENLSRMQVDTNVAEADVGKLKEGLEASFTVDAFPGRAFAGRIRQIRYAPQVVQNVVTYDAVIDVDNPEQMLRPGMTANVTFVHARVDDVLRVPNAALRFRLDANASTSGRRSGRPTVAAESAATGPSDRASRRRRRSMQRPVYVLGAEGPLLVQIRTGSTDGSFTEVVGGGLREGDAVIVDRRNRARKGARPSSGTPAAWVGCGGSSDAAARAAVGGEGIPHGRRPAARSGRGFAHGRGREFVAVMGTSGSGESGS